MTTTTTTTMLVRLLRRITEYIREKERERRELHSNCEEEVTNCIDRVQAGSRTFLLTAPIIGPSRVNSFLLLVQ